MFCKERNKIELEREILKNSSKLSLNISPLIGKKQPSL